MNECEVGNHDCGQHATCTNEIGGFKCECDAGYAGDGIICNDVDECSTGAHTCHEFAQCTNIDGSFDCQCVLGYSGNGQTCVTVDKCSQAKRPCEHGGTCVIAEPICKCPVGYYGSRSERQGIRKFFTKTENIYVPSIPLKNGSAYIPYYAIIGQPRHVWANTHVSLITSSMHVHVRSFPQSAFYRAKPVA